MTDEEERVVSTEPTERVVERPVQRTVARDDPAGTAIGASSLIQTIVWAIVVLVLLAVGLWALHVYLHMF